MAEATVTQTSADKKANKWARAKEMFTELDRLLAEMKQDREEIKCLQIRIRANLDETDTILGG